MISWNDDDMSIQEMIAIVTYRIEVANLLLKNESHS